MSMGLAGYDPVVLDLDGEPKQQAQALGRAGSRQ